MARLGWLEHPCLRVRSAVHYPVLLQPYSKIGESFESRTRNCWITTSRVAATPRTPSEIVWWRVLGPEQNRHSYEECSLPIEITCQWRERCGSNAHIRIFSPPHRPTLLHPQRHGGAWRSRTAPRRSTISRTIRYTNAPVKSYWHLLGDSNPAFPD